MTILADICREVFKARQERARKRPVDLGQRPPRLVIRVGNWDAYTADRVNRAPEGSKIDLTTFEGIDVEHALGIAGISVEWRL